VRPFDEVNDSDDQKIADWRGILIYRMREMDVDKVADEANLARQTVRDFVSGRTMCPSIRTFMRITRAVDARFALLKSGASPKQTHELRLSAKEVRFVRGLMREKE